MSNDFPCKGEFSFLLLTEIIIPQIIFLLSPSSTYVGQAFTISLIKQTNCKCICITLYNYTVHCTLSTTGQSVRRQHRKRNSEKSEMVTYKHVTEVVRNRCVNQQAKRMVSRAIVLLSATSVGALIIWIIKQTNINTANQTNKPNK